MSSNRENKVSIRFRYQRIYKHSFFENYSDSLDKKAIAENTEYRIETSMSVKPAQQVIVIGINAYLFTKSKNPQELLGIKTSHDFLIENFAEVIKTENDQCNLPDNFVINLLSMSYSSVRGMLFESITEPSYKRVLLPLINLKDFFENIKKAANNQ